LKEQKSPSLDDASPRKNEARQLLLQLRENFINELPARLEKLEQLVLHLKQPQDFTTQLGELLRQTHSLKGSGGSYGLPFISSVCHHLEEAYLSIDSSQSKLSPALLDHFLEYIDIMKDAIVLLQHNGDISHLENRLHGLKQKRVSGLSALLISSSRSVGQICRSAISQEHQVEWCIVDDAYQALGILLQEHFDFIVLSNELARLSGEAVIAALRLSAGVNRQTPVILISSSESLRRLADIHIDYVVKRDGRFVESLSQALAQVAARLAA